MIKWLVFLCSDVGGISLSRHGRFLEGRREGVDNHVGLFGIGLGNKQTQTNHDRDRDQDPSWAVREWLAGTVHERPATHTILQGSHFYGLCLIRGWLGRNMHRGLRAIRLVVLGQSRCPNFRDP